MKDVKLQIYSADMSTVLELPFADGGVKAGLPSPAQDYLTEAIDLNKYIVRHKESTFYARVSGDSMRDAGICDGTSWGAVKISFTMACGHVFYLKLVCW